MSRARGRSAQKVDCALLQQQLHQATDIHDVLKLADNLSNDINSKLIFDAVSTAEAIALCGGEWPQPGVARRVHCCCVRQQLRLTD